MPDEARLAIVIQEGYAAGSGSSAGGPAPQARPPLPPPATPPTPPMPGAAAPLAAPPPRPGPTPPAAPPPAPAMAAPGAARPPTPIAAPPPAPPPLPASPPPRPPATIVTAAPAAPPPPPEPRAWGQALAIALKTQGGGVPGGGFLQGLAEHKELAALPGLLGGVATVAGPLAIALGAVTLGLKVFGTVIDANIRYIQTEARISHARLMGNIHEQAIAESEQLTAGKVGLAGLSLPLAYATGQLRERERTKLTAREQKEQDYRTQAARLAAVSGPVAGAQTQVQQTQYFGAIEEANISGRAYAEQITLQAKRDAALRVIDAQRQKRELEQNNITLRMENDLAQLAKTFTDANDTLEVIKAIQQGEAGHTEELVRLTKKYQDQIRENQKKQDVKDEDMGRKLLGNILGNIANVPGGGRQQAQQQDLGRIARVDQAIEGIVPMF